MMEEDASTLTFGKDFENAECLSLSEVHAILKEREEQQENLEGKKDVFEKTLRYVERLAPDQSKETAKEIKKMLKSHKLKLHEFEIAQLANLEPASPDEAKILIPSLSRFEDEHEIGELLNDLKNLRDTAR
jgi:DNA-directed RNA polymerase subunit F